MRATKFALLAIIWVLIIFPASASDNSASANSGRLVRWSGPTKESRIKLIFIHGCDVNPLSGGNREKAETRFATKVDDLNYLSKERFKMPLSDFVELWFYEYNSDQEIDKLADDLAHLISHNPAFNSISTDKIAAIGYSQGGVVLWELMQHHSGLIEGGICLGAPIMSTPIVHKDVRDKAVQKLFPRLHWLLIPLYDKLAKGTSQLDFHRDMPMPPLPSKLFLFAGLFKPPIYSGWLAKFAAFVRRYTDLLDALVAAGGNFFTGLQDQRQFADVLSMIIYRSEWSGGTDWDRLSDGLVPLSSALVGTAEDDQRKLFKSYNHSDLLAGQGDLVIDRAIFDCLDQILGLTPKAILPFDLDLPPLPEMANLVEQSSQTSPLSWAKFTYIREPDQQLCIADKNWQREFVMPMVGSSMYPQFHPQKPKLVWSIDRHGFSNVFLWQGNSVQVIDMEHVNQNRLASFSPNGKWLAYQSGDELVALNFQSGKRRSLVKGINLASPPVWTAEWLTGKIYLANRSSDGKVDLYQVSPRWRRARDITEVPPIATNCGNPHLVRGWLGGVITTQSEWDNSGNLIAQRIILVSGILKGHYSVEIRVNATGNSTISSDGRQTILEINQGIRVETVALDGNANCLYFVDTLAGSPDIYKLELSLLTSDEEISFEALLSKQLEGAGQLDINTLVE